VVIRDQILNVPADFLTEALEGFELAHRKLVSWNRDPSYVTRSRAHALADKVALIAGGGSGHEPLHVGLVGPGMLDAAVPGVIFTSPSAAQIAAASRAVVGSGGGVFIVKNYTGDLLNFRAAADEMADDGIPVQTVLVADDLATTADDGFDGPSGRGTAATVVVEKICGAAAERGADRATVVSLGLRAAAASKSLAFALAGSRRPGQRTASFTPPEGLYEFGVGIHGERGVSRRKLSSARQICEEITTPLAQALELRPGAQVLVIVNGLGSATPLELNLVYREVHALLYARGVAVTRCLVGTYVTALDMHGCSLTVTVLDDEMTRLWDAPVHTPALRW
jgi:phosphoenolpyruvate---glycerone phosphotransferase subunit DhaK